MNSQTDDAHFFAKLASRESCSGSAYTIIQLKPPSRWTVRRRRRRRRRQRRKKKMGRGRATRREWRGWRRHASHERWHSISALTVTRSRRGRQDHLRKKHVLPHGLHTLWKLIWYSMFPKYLDFITCFSLGRKNEKVKHQMSSFFHVIRNWDPTSTSYVQDRRTPTCGKCEDIRISGCCRPLRYCRSCRSGPWSTPAIRLGQHGQQTSLCHHPT